MEQTEILDALKSMTPVERFSVVEAAIRLLREDIDPSGRAIAMEEKRLRMAAAAAALQGDYENDKELTAFTALDGEDFYEYDEK